MSSRPVTVADLGELALLERMLTGLAPASSGEVWSGDDAAFFRARSERLLLTTDAMVEHVDFELEYCSGEDVGWKVVAINASDIAAMGGRPAQAVATLALPPHTHVSFVDGVVRGMTSAARRWGIELVGGDLSQAAELTLSIALLGSPPAAAPVLRSGAAPGEAICVTGSLGGAAGGLVVLQRGLGRDSSPAGALVTRQLRPAARVDEAERLVAAGATAMIDVSDGLAVDLGHLTEASSIGCRVEQDRIPVDENLGWLADQLDGRFHPLATAITGGEDYELLFTIANERVGHARASLQELGTALVRIGTATESGHLIGEDDLEGWRKRGWQHLLNR